MTNKEFVNKLIEVKKYQTAYAKGTFGQKATDSFINQKQKQYPSWYTTARVKSLKAMSDETRLFDCVGLGKGVLWGFPNIVYTSNGVPDMNDDMMWNSCTEQSKDFSKIEVGEILWIKGHVGYYIGNGKAIECTTAWTSNVQVTAVLNIGKITGLNGRKWTAHGKLKYITYATEEKPVNNSSTNVSNYPVIKKGSNGNYVAELKKLLIAKGYLPYNDVFDEATLNAVKKFQSENTDTDGKKLVVDGYVGPKTWGALYK